MKGATYIQYKGSAQSCHVVRERVLKVDSEAHSRQYKLFVLYVSALACFSNLDLSSTRRGGRRLKEERRRRWNDASTTLAHNTRRLIRVRTAQLSSTYRMIKYRFTPDDHSGNTPRSFLCVIWVVLRPDQIQAGASIGG